ncbi:MAG: CDP-diacylglycerol--glycerol-3-phosphate 3-phosphatidyltransferase [Clostridia bacterium]
MNLPNKISMLRIFLIPIMIFFYLANFIPNNQLIACIILIIAASTDFIDGYIARKNNLVTDLGKFLDPIADKILTMAALLLVIADGTIPSPYGAIIGIIIIGREFAISAFRQIAATKNFVMAADKWGKIKTIVSDISLPALFLLAFFSNSNIMNAEQIFGFQIFNYVLIGIATVLTIISGMNYLIKNRRVFK